MIEKLKDLPEGVEVRLALQPGWAMEHSVDQLVEVDGVAYISDGGYLNYLPVLVGQVLGNEWNVKDEDEEFEEDLDHNPTNPFPLGEEEAKRYAEDLLLDSHQEGK